MPLQPAVLLANLQIMAEDKPVEDSQAVIIGGDTNPIGITGNTRQLSSLILHV